MPQNYCYFQRFHVLLQVSIINAMEAKHNSDNFEAYWAEHKSELIARAPQQLRQEREDALKMNTAGDWLLAIVPIIVMVAFLSAGLIRSEILNFAAAALIGFAIYVLTMLVKPYVTGKRSLVDIDNDIKAYFRQQPRT